MKKKYLYSAIVPIVAAAVIGGGTALAHGWFSATTATPDEIAAQHQTMFQKEADLLGLNVDQIKDAWAQGKTLPEIAQDHGISQTALQQKLAGARKQRLADELKALVDKGIITQTQADQRLKVMQDRIDNGGMHMRGFHHDFDGEAKTMSMMMH